MACQDIAAPRLPLAVETPAPPPAPPRIANLSRLLLVAIPVSAALWTGIILLALRIRSAL